MNGRALTACVLGALSLTATPAAAGAPKVTPGSKWLSLGDSLTFGYMEPTVVPAPNYHKAASFLGYPEQLGAQLRLRVTNPACPGETSASLIDRNAPSLGCENAYRKEFPLHVRYTGSQLSFALRYLRANRNTRLVSLMVGANDLFLCQRTTPDHCTGRATFAAALHRISRNVRTILSRIRNQARYRGQLVIVNYYSLNYSAALVNSNSRALNDAVEVAARPFGVRFADGFGLLRTASAHSGGDPCKAGLLTQLSTGGCGAHPSYAGQALLAQAVAKALRL
jgi:lysophospholipase L1-like esterase